jgi:hypothetical protein
MSIQGRMLELRRDLKQQVLAPVIRDELYAYRQPRAAPVERQRYGRLTRQIVGHREEAEGAGQEMARHGGEVVEPGRQLRHRGRHQQVEPLRPPFRYATDARDQPLVRRGFHGREANVPVRAHPGGRLDVFGMMIRGALAPRIERSHNRTGRNRPQGRPTRWDLPASPDMTFHVVSERLEQASFPARPQCTPDGRRGCPVRP